MLITPLSCVLLNSRFETLFKYEYDSEEKKILIEDSTISPSGDSIVVIRKRHPMDYYMDIIILDRQLKPKAQKALEGKKPSVRFLNETTIQMDTDDGAYEVTIK